jgi:hypothetical protein
MPFIIILYIYITIYYIIYIHTIIYLLLCYIYILFCSIYIYIIIFVFILCIFILYIYIYIIYSIIITIYHYYITHTYIYTYICSGHTNHAWVYHAKTRKAFRRRTKDSMSSTTFREPMEGQFPWQLNNWWNWFRNWLMLGHNSKSM